MYVSKIVLLHSSVYKRVYRTDSLGDTSSRHTVSPPTGVLTAGEPHVGRLTDLVPQNLCP